LYKEITQKIIDLLKADADLSEPSKIKKYYFGVPVKPPDRYPTVYVQFDGRRATGKANIKQFLYELTFEVGIADRAVKEDDAEKSVYDKAEKVESVLRANPDLAGLVADTRSEWEIEVVRAREEDYAISMARIFCTFQKWME